MAESVPPLLAPEDLTSQLSTIEVLLSIYNGSSDLINNNNEEEANLSKEVVDGSLEVDDVNLSLKDYNAIRNLAQFLSLSLGELGQPQSVQLRDTLPTIIQLGIKLDPLRGTLNEEEEEVPPRFLILNAGFALRRIHQATKVINEDDTLKPRWSLRQADWLDRLAYDSICQAAKSIKWEKEESVGYIMNVIEAISEASLEYISKAGDGAANTKNGHIVEVRPLVSSTSSPHVLRTWHLLVSLSTKEKRKDLVSYAARYNLTGFVLAGKPGLVVLEHAMEQGDDINSIVDVIDKYWSDIKTISWSDIPPGHKKVSQKHQEVLVPRCFQDMQEISNLGEISSSEVIEAGRVRKNDLDKVKTWLQKHGCGSQLDIVLGKAQVQ